MFPTLMGTLPISLAFGAGAEARRQLSLKNSVHQSAKVDKSCFNLDLAPDICFLH